MKAIKAIVSLAFFALCANACGVLDDPASNKAAPPAGVCWKRTTVRGAGVISSECPGGEKSGGLCYPRCPPGYAGVGPVCWMRCSGEMPVECGAGCARSQEACAQAIADQVLTSAEMAVVVALMDWGSAIARGLDVANSFRLPICGGR
jgi:hypothetical protein